MTQIQLQNLIINTLGPLCDVANKIVSRHQRGQHDETLFKTLEAKVNAARSAAALAVQPARTTEMSNSDTRLDPAPTNWVTLVNS